MREIQSQVTIDKPQAQVWDILSDITAMGNYMPGIKEVHFTSENKEGVGAARHCTFEDGVELHERVLRWQEGQGYTLETTQFVNVPMKANEITFSLAEDGNKTVLTQSMQYRMKGGLFAPIMELMATGMMKKAINGALAGLKEYVEAQA